MLSVFVGIGLFIASLFLFHRTHRLSSLPALARWWSVLATMVCFFLAGYSVFLYSLISGREIEFLRPLVSQIFLWGSVFVLLCSWLFYATTREKASMLADQAENHRKLHEASQQLENRVDERTSELAAANAHLEKEIGERRRLEEQRFEARLQHSQKLESLGVLAGGIAHDFNNILVSILGNASLLKKTAAGEGPAAEALGEIELAAQRASDLANQMLAYSGRGRFILEELDLNRVVKEYRDLLSASISKKAHLDFELDAALPMISGDATQIRQIVMNLIINASDALHEQEGQITVTTKIQPIDRDDVESIYLEGELTAGRYVVLEVADDGCGMDDATRERMFDPFFTTKATGRGLGLAASLGIVRGHGGAVKIESEFGRGTTIRVLFPESPGRSEERPAEAEPAESPASRGIVLIADDEAGVRRVLKRMLELDGFEVIATEDGRECVDVFSARSDEISLVILDLSMPRLGGAEAIRELRKVRRDVAVILSSGYDEQESTARFGRDGVAGFLRKPYDEATLLGLVRSTHRLPAH